MKKQKNAMQTEKHTGKKVLKIVGITVACLLVLCIGFVSYFLIADYRPEEVIKLETAKGSSAEKEIPVDQPLTVMTANIGYCGLDHDTDFFMDGGTMSGAISEERVQSAMVALGKHFEKIGPDLLLLQEVDEDAKRSFHVNEKAYYQKLFGAYDSVFAYNYKVPFVPIPLGKPMGGVKGGILTLSAYELYDTTRIALPGDMSWPADSCSLDRCFMVSRMKTSDGKELVLMNMHLSAYDKGGNARKIQLEKMEKIIEDEYKKGNYVIVGGDWNHVLPGTDPLTFPTEEKWPSWLQKLPADFKPEGFHWGVDGSYPSNRDTGRPYEAGVNFRSNIDGFLVSDNMTIEAVETSHMNFIFSDHNPVTMQITFKQK